MNIKESSNKNIHIVPTDNPSRLFESTDGGLSIDDELQPNGIMCQNINICITSDEEIKEGDWFINFDLLGRLDTIYDPKHKCLKVSNSTITSFEVQVEDEFTILKSFCKKIILTDDKDLIKDGVQSIDDEFLEWFVKNPSCEEIEVERTFIDTVTGKPIRNWSEYKIIIPKEEPKQKWDINTCRYWNIEIGCEREKCICENTPIEEPKKKTLEEALKQYDVMPSFDDVVRINQGRFISQTTHFTCAKCGGDTPLSNRELLPLKTELVADKLVRIYFPCPKCSQTYDIGLSVLS